MEPLKTTGLAFPEVVPWGAHFCQFYETGDDLLDVLVPYFAEGLKANDYCIWIASDPISVEQAKASLRRAVAGLDDHLASGRMEIIAHDEWYVRGGVFDAEAVLENWIEKLAAARGRGFDGLRASGNAACVIDDHWRDFIAYEAQVQAAINDHRMIALCTYPLDRCTASEFLEVVQVHDYAFVRRNGVWEGVESTAQKRVERVRRERAEQALRESEGRYRALVEGADVGITLIDSAYNIVTANRKQTELIGRSADDLIGKKCYREYEGRQEVCPGCPGARAMATGRPAERDASGRRIDGSEFAVRLKASPVFDAGGETAGFIEVVEDIRQRKIQEDKIAWLASFPGEDPNPVLRVGPDGAILYANPAGSLLLDAWGCVEGDRLPDPWRRAALDALDSASGRQAECAVGGRVCALTFAPVVDGGYVNLYGLDITDRKQAEEALRASEARYRKLFEEATEGVVLADAETGEVLDCNQTFLRLSGYDRLELIGKPQTVLHRPEEGNPPFSRTFARHREDGDGQVLFAELVTRSGAVRQVQIKANLLEIDGRRVLQGLFRDVTVEVRYHRERETTLRLLRLLNYPNDTRELIHSLTGFLQQCTGCEAIGVRLRAGDDYPYFETRGFPAEFVEAESRLCDRDAAGNVVRDACGDPVLQCMCGNVLCGRFNPALPFFTSKGSFWTNCTSELLASAGEADRQARPRNRCNGEGYESAALFALRHGSETLGLLQVNDRAKGRFTPELIAFLEYAADQIAMALAQRQAREALRISEEKYRRYVGDSPLGIFVADAQGRFVEVNPAACQMTGFSQEELGRMTIPEILAPAALETGMRHFGQVKETGRAVGELALRRKGGGAVDTAISAVRLTTDRFISFCQDITDRKRAEAALRDSLEEKTALLKEVHHRVKNNLQIVASLLNLQARRSHDGQAVEALRETGERVRSMALLHEALYRSGNLARINFASYVEELCMQIWRSFGSAAARIALQKRVAPLRLSLEQALPCGLIINELVSNALKHGFRGERAGRVVVELGPAEQRRLALCVSNDGVALPPSLDLAQSPTLGLRLVFNLAGQLGGAVTVERPEQGGAAFRVVFPAAPQDGSTSGPVGEA